jgi:uncharacterized membrane protein
MNGDDLGEMAKRFLDKNIDSLEDEERRVLDRIKTQEPVSRHAAVFADGQSTYGDRLADRVARVGGSWAFIIVFGVVLTSWMLLNTVVLAQGGLAFDPYPFIFLNLILSMLAAIQAPVIMMSQNRQAAKDRLSAGLDYEVNLRAELEIIRLHAKIDQAVASRLDAVLEQQAAIVRRLDQVAPKAGPQDH